MEAKEHKELGVPFKGTLQVQPEGIKKELGNKPLRDFEARSAVRRRRVTKQAEGRKYLTNKSNIFSRIKRR